MFPNNKYINHTDAAAFASGHDRANNSEQASICYSALPIHATPSVGYYEEVAETNARNEHSSIIVTEADVSFRNFVTSTPKSRSSSSSETGRHRKKPESPHGLEPKISCASINPSLRNSNLSLGKRAYAVLNTSQVNDSFQIFINIRLITTAILNAGFHRF